MRQKENLETFLESLLLSDDAVFKTDSSITTHTSLPNHITSHTSLPPLNHVQRFQMSPLPVDPSSNSNNFVTQDIIEIKTLLVKVKTLLERESSLEELSKDTHHHHDTSEQRRLLEQQLETMKQELKLKNDKIEELEKIINTKKETVSTQTRRTQAVAAAKIISRRSVGVSSAKSLHNISISHVNNNSDRQSPAPSQEFRPCQHSWGPCANDHTYHHARPGHGTTHVSSTRPVSPWSPTSSSSSGSFHETVRHRRIETGSRYKKRALSADLLNNNSSREVGKQQEHKISIYVSHKPSQL